VLKCWSGDTSMQQQVIQALTTTNTTYCCNGSALQLWRLASLSPDLFLPCQSFPQIVPLTTSPYPATQLHVSHTHATTRNQSSSSPQTTSVNNEHLRPFCTSHQNRDLKPPEPIKKHGAFFHASPIPDPSSQSTTSQLSPPSPTSI